MIKVINKNILYIAFFLAFLATLGSLFFSEVMHLPPCVLCWYQRVCMYPLVFILAVSIMKKIKEVHLLVLPLSVIGMLIAIYHNLLYYKIIPESIAPCAAGVSCTTRFFEWFGFITIPFLSLIAFVLINICMFLYWKFQYSQDTKSQKVVEHAQLKVKQKNSRKK